MHSGLLCITSGSAFFQGDVVRWLFMHGTVYIDALCSIIWQVLWETGLSKKRVSNLWRLHVGGKIWGLCLNLALFPGSSQLPSLAVWKSWESLASLLMWALHNQKMAKKISEWQKIPGSPHFPYCKWRKAGRSLGTRLGWGINPIFCHLHATFKG